MRNYFGLGIVLLVVGLLVGCDAAPVPEVGERPPTRAAGSRRAVPSYDEAACPFEEPEGVRVTCGYLSVPENRSRAASPTIRLAVAILHARTRRAAPDGIVYLAGGPGNSGVTELLDDPAGWADYPFAGRRDLVFVDQRGTGFSEPTLNCPELEEVDWEGDSEEPQFDAVVACHDRLVAEGVELAAYNTTESAADVADLRRALGYEEWNVLGVSYGTRLALTLMRDHPEGLRSVILDSPYPLNLDIPAEDALTSLATLRTLFEGCVRDAPCDEAYPDLEEVLKETVARLNEEPDTVEGEDEEGELVEWEVYGDDLVYTIGQAQYDEGLIPLLPRTIYEVSEGVYDTYKLLSGEAGGAAARYQEESEETSDSEGLFNSVTCREDYAFSSFEEVAARTASIPEELQSAIVGGVESQYAECAIWGAGRAARRENAAVVSSLPTLVLVGEYDPVTPPRWAALTVETLSRAFLVEVPSAGHALISSGECPTGIMADFIEEPLREPETGCIEEAFPPIEFYLPDEEIDW